MTMPGLSVERAGAPGLRLENRFYPVKGIIFRELLIRSIWTFEILNKFHII